MLRNTVAVSLSLLSASMVFVACDKQGGDTKVEAKETKEETKEVIEAKDEPPAPEGEAKEEEAKEAAPEGEAKEEEKEGGW